MTIATWFKDPKNEEAREFVEQWLDQASEGKTDLSISELQYSLIHVDGFPFTDRGSFGRRLRKMYGAERYDRAVKMTNRAGKS